MDKRILVTFFVLMGVITNVPNNVIAQESYPMICRGGGAMSANANASGSIRLAFAWGPGANSSPPQPGQCSWLDRGARAGEPNSLVVSNDRGTAAYLIQSMFGGGNFYVHVYNNSAGGMVVTKTGP